LVIAEHPILIIAQGEQRFGRVWLKLLRVLQRIFSYIGARGVNTLEVKIRVRAGESRPSGRKIWVKVCSLLEITNSFQHLVVREVNSPLKRYAAQIRVVSFWIVCWLSH